MKALLDDRRVLLPVLLTALAIAVGSVLIVLLSDDASDGSASSSSAAIKGATRIDIADYKYKPVSVTVKAGSKITWVNHDSSPHTATAGGAGGFDTGTLKKGQRKTLKLGKPGTYAYICEFHPFMKATVVVT